MTWIKICGITNPEDARAAVEAGADALGFVFYEKSPRNIRPDTAREIVAKLPSGVKKVGVFVGALSERTITIYNYAKLTALQLHLEPESLGSACGNGRDVAGYWQLPEIYISMPAARFSETSFQVDAAIGNAPNGEQSSFNTARQFRNPWRAFFLDSSTRQRPGGTGATFDWQALAPIVHQVSRVINVVIAGGLTPANVGHAIQTLQPWGVDVSSGVEAAPGRKDPAKVRAFIRAVRQADKN